MSVHKFGTNIVGEMCTNSVTWFCAYLCKTEDTVNYACCNIWCTTQPFMTFVSKYLQKCASFYLLLLRNISEHCADSKNTTSFNVSSTLFSTSFVLFSWTPFGTKSCLYPTGTLWLLSACLYPIGAYLLKLTQRAREKQGVREERQRI